MFASQLLGLKINFPIETVSQASLRPSGSAHSINFDPDRPAFRILQRYPLRLRLAVCVKGEFPGSDLQKVFRVPFDLRLTGLLSLGGGSFPSPDPSLDLSRAGGWLAGRCVEVQNLGVWCEAKG